MWFTVSCAKRARGCFTCRQDIQPGKWHFEYHEWKTGMEHPVKENICLECSKKLTATEFIDFIKILCNQLTSVKGTIPTLEKKNG